MSNPKESQPGCARICRALQRLEETTWVCAGLPSWVPGDFRGSRLARRGCQRGTAHCSDSTTPLIYRYALASLLLTAHACLHTPVTPCSPALGQCHKLHHPQPGHQALLPKYSRASGKCRLCSLSGAPAFINNQRSIKRLSGATSSPFPTSSDTNLLS